MPDEMPTNEEIYDDLEYLYQDKQYYNYLTEQIGGLLLLNLWDICLLVARNMIYEGSIPDCINDIAPYLVHELEPNSEEESALLKTVQQWLAEQITKSIDKNEMEAEVVGLFIDGKIDVKRTYIDEGQIDDWLIRRGIDAACSDEYLTRAYADSIDRIYNVVMNQSNLLAAKVYNPNFIIPPLDSIEADHLIFENARLRTQIDQISSRKSNHRNSHGNTERFAKNREEVLGAALSVIIQWSEQCKNSSGKFEATKIAKLIDEKSLLFWAETNEPPLSLEKMEREISKWINKASK